MERAYDSDASPDRARSFHSSLTVSCIPRIDRATVSLIAVQNSKIVHDRSGVLYRIGDHYFVLTAAHDLQDIVKHNIGLYVSMNHPAAMPMPLTRAKFIGTEADCRDLSAIWTPPDIASEISKYKQFLKHNQISQSFESMRALLLFYGYPAHWSGHTISETSIVSTALAFSTYEDHLDPNTVLNYDPRIHMLLNYTHNAIHALSGDTHAMPSLQGISGCGIWQVGVRHEKGAMPHTDETLTLVGIQHGVFTNLDRVKATRIEYALGLIVDHYPETRAAMSLAYPTS